jgi:RNA polymerase sigma factor (sigma-70 family)
MDEESTRFAQLMQRVRAGEPEAAQELFDRYGKYVLRVVRKRLQRRLRRRYDSTDFAQAVWATFFTSSADRYSFDTPAELMAFLSRVAANTVEETTRRHLGTLRYDIKREQSLDDPPPDGEVKIIELMPGRLPTPSQSFIADECWQRMVEGLEPGHRRVLELLRDGDSHVTIAEKLGVPRKVIQRLLEYLEYHLDTP